MHRQRQRRRTADDAKLRTRFTENPTYRRKRKSRNHRFLAAFFAYFLLLLAKSMPSETRSLRKAPLLTKSMPPELKACRSSWKMRPFPVARCRRTDFHYIVFYRRTKSCFDQTVDPCSAGYHGCSAGLGTVLLPCCYRRFVYSA